MNRTVKDTVIIVSFVLFGILTRTIWHVAPNVEFVTAFSIAGAYFIRKSYSFFIPLGIMVISDWILGNSSIFLFTWSAFAFAWILGRVIKSVNIERALKRLPRLLRLSAMSELSGVLFTIFFFLWTNFGVVIVSSLYPKTFEGVLQSYVMGVPFLIPHLIGNMIIVPAVFMIADFACNGNFKWLDDILISKTNLKDNG